MSEDRTDSRLKYLDMPRAFYLKANEIDMACKRSQRMCAKLATQLAHRKPKTAEEFERVEAMKQFVIETATVNDKTIELLEYMQNLLKEVAVDAHTLVDGALLRDQLVEQSDSIKILTAQRDDFMTALYESRRNKETVK